MTLPTTQRTRIVVLAVALMFLATVATAQTATPQKTISEQFAASAGLIVELENLAGTVTVTGGGDQVSVSADIHADSAALAEQLTIDFQQQGDRLIVKAVYPVDKHDTYYYPSSSSESGLASFFGGSRTSTRYQGRKVTVTSKSKSGAVTLYADFRIQLPAGVGAAVDNAVGNIRASGVDGPFSADTGSGSITAADGAGRFSADTGSGDVAVSDHRGDVSVDTGSGDVMLARVTGSVETDTGSGDVEMEDVEGETIEADTGSGEVRLSRVRGEISADTGSGGVEGRDVVATGRLNADTGSGGISFQGDFSEVDSISLDAGSGGVTLEGALPPLDLEISTGSRGIDVDLPGLEIIEQDKDEEYLEARYLGGGVRVSIDTGSGRVRIGL